MAKSKVTKSHLTFIPEADDFQSYLAGLPEVSKLTAGFIKPLKASQRRLKAMLEPACILFTVRGVCAVQEVRAYVEPQNAAKVIDLAKNFARDNNWNVT